MSVRKRVMLHGLESVGQECRRCSRWCQGYYDQLGHVSCGSKGRSLVHVRPLLVYVVGTTAVRQVYHCFWCVFWCVCVNRKQQDVIFECARIFDVCGESQERVCGLLFSTRAVHNVAFKFWHLKTPSSEPACVASWVENPFPCITVRSNGEPMA